MLRAAIATCTWLRRDAAKALREAVFLALHDRYPPVHLVDLGDVRIVAIIE